MGFLLPSGWKVCRMCNANQTVHRDNINIFTSKKADDTEVVDD